MSNFAGARMMTKKQRQQLADQLRQAILNSGITLYQLSQQSGVHRSQLSRFMREKRDLGLVIADKLCEVLGLKLTSDGTVSPVSPASVTHATDGAKPKKSRGRPRKGK
jgi:transcriptional regulator with XRE-family HTH domain